ncbi:hypothetical protein JAAARDRAFT_166584 [Jaapia argillacea MUCL 33604]|uniref:Arf-GAP domain-containing protein n=1 Tax=Jaapia argillacea MUCL 33604 TaxID=933084 RepID=A0A067QLL4_9AGAM|nr:hypothetical protein JAAARDRAFT_166584 [Jaapia argillacea MUCL 33604]
MTDQVAAKRVLQELIKRDDLKNKTCVDCGNPNPQWASLSFAVFLCLQCAGLHRGFGVHISFVRSVSMDTWQPEQIRRMTLGGNDPFRQFMRSYPTEQGGYTDGMTPYDTYHCWAATQYREKLDADLAGKPWAISSPPAGYLAPGSGSNTPSRPSSAQGLRKSRTSARSNTGSGLRGDSRPDSPASLSNSPNPNPSSPDQKSANESYFATLGQANASRPEHLPPSQGGRYQGFGSSPSPPSGSQHPSFGLSSAAAPSISEFQENPVAALSKGWSLLSSAVVATTRVVQQNVIQPGLEKVMDPSLQANVKGYVSEASKRAGELGSTANQWGKNQFGVDMAEHVGGVVGTVKDTMGVGRPDRSGYGSLDMEHNGETSALYHDDDDEFFDSFNSPQEHEGPSATTTSASAPSKAPAVKHDEWDEW